MARKTSPQQQQQQQDSNGKQTSSPTLTRTRIRRQGEHLTEDERVKAQAKFLAVYSEGNTITQACKAARIDRDTLYRWKEHDTAFLVRFNQAKEAGDDVIRQEIKRRAIDGWDEEVYQLGNYAGTVHKYSDRLIEILAKSRMPEFRDKVDVKATVQGNMSHDHTFADDNPEAAAHARALIRSLTTGGPAESGGVRVSGE